jgi:hypothetical protein
MAILNDLGAKSFQGFQKNNRIELSKQCTQKTNYFFPEWHEGLLFNPVKILKKA